MKTIPNGKISRVLEAGAAALNDAAKAHGATYGGGVVGIVTANGRQRFEAIALDNVIENAWPQSDITGKCRRNYTLTAMQKALQALRRGIDSTDDETLVIKGEVAFVGGAYDIIRSTVVGNTEFVAAWSSMSSQDDLATSREAIDAMKKVFIYHCILT